MSDETEAAKPAAGAKGKMKAAAGAKASAGKAAKPAAGEGGGGTARVEGQVARMLVRAIWLQEWNAANPDGKPEDRKAAWAAAREAAIEKNMKAYRRALGSLVRAGVAISYTPTASKPGADAEDDGED